MDEEIKKYEKLIYVSMYYFFKTGDRRAWQRIAGLHNCDMEDLIQIGRITIWKALQSFDEDVGTISNYIIKSIKNEIQSELIRLKRLNKRGIDDERREAIAVHSLNTKYGEQEEVQDILIGDENFSEISINDLDFQEKLKKLSLDEQRAVIWTLQGYNLQDIAKATGISRETWKWRRLQAVKKLTGVIETRTKTQNQDTFIQLFNEGKSKEYIMEHLNINADTSYRRRLHHYRKKGLLPK